MVYHAPLVWAWALALPAALRIALDLRWASAWRRWLAVASSRSFASFTCDRA